MTKAEFWDIVNRVHGVSGGGVDIGKKEELLADELRELSLQEVRSFYEHFCDCRDRAYTWDVWAAAYIIGGGCSDDDFQDFRSSLIAMGQAIYESALDDPESLADLGPNAVDLFYLGYQNVPGNVVEELGGGELVRSHPHPVEPSGRKWNISELPAMYPKLVEEFDFSSD